MSESFSSKVDHENEVRIPLEVNALRSPARVRLVAAACVGFGSSLAVAMRTPSTLEWIVILAGYAATFGWLLSVMRTYRRIASSHSEALVLNATGIVLVEPQSKTKLDWEEITSIEADEDRIAVAVLRRNETPFWIQPNYGSLGVHELSDRIRAYREGLAPRAPATDN